MSYGRISKNTAIGPDYCWICKNRAIDPLGLLLRGLGHGWKRGYRPNYPIATFLGAIAAFLKCGYSMLNFVHSLIILDLKKIRVVTHFFLR